MKNKIWSPVIIVVLVFLGQVSFASVADFVTPHTHENLVSQTVIMDLDKARALEAMILSFDESENIAVAYLNPNQMDRLITFNHASGKCGGFEALSAFEARDPAKIIAQFKSNQNQFYSLNLRKYNSIPFDQAYADLALLANPESLEKTIKWISSYPHRYNKAPEPNRHVDDLSRLLETELHDAPWEYMVEKINHNSTRQKTVRLTIKGSTRPNEVIALGGHFDSINQSFFGNSEKAPGADDNASGSSNLLEAVRILKNWKQFDRTLEFYWYAGEESGLLGSGEIATEAKNVKKNVIGVLQLDMTLFPGSGEQVIGLVTDYTSPWLRDLLSQINAQYLKARFVADECGYACSDHASWHRQGFHAVTPFEATTETMNRNIHTERDILDQRSSLSHSNTFTKIAVLFALVLGNSELKP